MKLLRSTLLALAASANLHAQILITEYMYSGRPAEFIEFTNVGAASVDMTGWSYDDNSRTAGTVSLSAFGTVAPGESVILTESSAPDFRTVWGLPASVKVIGGLTTNLGRNDEINLYNSLNELVDRLTYGDETFAGTIRTQNRSGWAPFASLGTNTIAAWVLSVVGDAQNSYAAPVNGDLGNPGRYVIPEPSTYAALLAGLGLAAVVLRRRR